MKMNASRGLKATALGALLVSGCDSPTNPTGVASTPRFHLEDSDGYAGPNWTDAGTVAHFLDSSAAFTLLPDKRVLAAEDQYDYLYSPSTNGWSAGPTPSYALDSYSQTMTNLLDGRVLIVGYQATAPGGDISQPDTVLFDPSLSSFAVGPALTESRRGQAAVRLLDGRVLVVGGSYGGFVPRQTAEIYDPSTNGWTSAGQVSHAGGNRAVLLQSGKVLYVSSLPGAISSDIFDPATGKWSTAAPMSVARRNSNFVFARLGDGRVLAASGFDKNYNAIASAETYDPDSDSWTTVPSMNMARANPGVAVLQNQDVLVAGGESAASQSSAEVFDWKTNTWIATPPLVHPATDAMAATLSDGRVLVASGSASQIFDPHLDVGVGCSGALDCHSGFCVEGVCCDTACDTDGCGVCTVVDGADTDGTCKALTGNSCSGGTCDAGVCVPPSTTASTSSSTSSTSSSTSSTGSGSGGSGGTGGATSTSATTSTTTSTSTSATTSTSTSTSTGASTSTSAGNGGAGTGGNGGSGSGTAGGGCSCSTAPSEKDFGQLALVSLIGFGYSARRRRSTRSCR